ncbi:hypothetical protein [Pedobacter glucosidilyticus]|uniref:hypothetical protein n=1 Tax=Pedobacter glucosidilyticus TaxID=1122941 RepID=UPI0026E95251|nr:hypothetical protein [Pedobacter glucosidilyticus]
MVQIYHLTHDFDVKIIGFGKVLAYTSLRNKILRKMENKSKIAAIVVAGIAAGAAAWYFTRSESGKQNWSALVDGVKDLTDHLKRVASKQADKVNDLSKETSDYLVAKAHEASNFSDDTLSNISAKVAKEAKTLSS